MRPSMERLQLTGRLSHSEESLGSQTSLVGLLDLMGGRREWLVRMAEREGRWIANERRRLTPEADWRRQFGRKRWEDAGMDGAHTVAPPLLRKRGTGKIWSQPRRKRWTSQRSERTYHQGQEISIDLLDESRVLFLGVVSLREHAVGAK